MGISKLKKIIEFCRVIFEMLTSKEVLRSIRAMKAKRQVAAQLAEPKSSKRHAFKALLFALALIQFYPVIEATKWCTHTDP